MRIICGKSYENHMNKHMLIICSKIHMVLIWFALHMRSIWKFWMYSYENHMKQICHDNLFIHHFKILCFSSNTMIFSLCCGLDDETIKLSDDKDWNLRSVVNFWYTTHGYTGKIAACETRFTWNSCEIFHVISGETSFEICTYIFHVNFVSRKCIQELYFQVKKKSNEKKKAH